MGGKTPEEWREIKKAVAKGLAEGISVPKLAKEHKITERVIFKWKKDAKFMSKVAAIHQEFVQHVSQKRIRQTAAITDAVMQKYQLYMLELLKPPRNQDPRLIAEAEEFMPLITKELHNLRTEERTDFGQVQSRVGHLHHHTGQVDVTHKHTHAVSFQRYIEEVGKEIDVTASDEQAAIVKGARQLLAKNPTLITTMQEEDKQEAAAILAANPKRANR